MSYPTGGSTPVDVSPVLVPQPPPPVEVSPSSLASTLAAVAMNIERASEVPQPPLPNTPPSSIGTTTLTTASTSEQTQTQTQPPPPIVTTSSPVRAPAEELTSPPVGSLSPLTRSTAVIDSARVHMDFEPLAAACVFLGAVCPLLGVHAFEQFIAPDLHRKKTDAPEQQTAALAPAPVAPKRKAQGALFHWTWPSLQLAFHEALSFSLPTWLTQSEPFGEQLARVRQIICSEKRFLTSPHFLTVARPLAWILSGLLAWLLLAGFSQGVEWSMKGSLLYALRFYVLTAASFAAVCSVHTRGLLTGHRAVQHAREAVLEELPIKFVSIPSSTPGTTPQLPSSQPHWSVLDRASALAASSTTPQATTADAKQLLQAIDRLSKLDKAHVLERRLVWVAIISAVRGLVGGSSAWSSGSGFFTSLLYCVFHALVGFIFFALCVILEFELREDNRRWGVFSAIHSEEKCRARGIPFYLPLATLGRGQNIAAWYAIRRFLRDLKGVLDYKRMEAMLAFILIQLLSVCGLGIYFSYFQLGLSPAGVYEHVIGTNLLVAFDTFLCLSILLDMVAEAVGINGIIGSHTRVLLEEQVSRSFALSASNASSPSPTEGSHAMVDSLHQIAVLREKIAADREAEKLTLFGIKVDESLLRYIRTALVSYALVFIQSLFTRTTHPANQTPPTIKH